MSVVLDTCALVDFFDESIEGRRNTTVRKERLSSLLKSHNGYLSSVCAAEALYLLGKYPEDASYDILLKHLGSGSDICSVIDVSTNIKILEKAAEFYGRGFAAESAMTAAIAVVKEWPIVTVMLTADARDDYSVLEEEGVVIRI